MTELGDAELTEQGVVTLSDHKTPQAGRLYANVQRNSASPLQESAVSGSMQTKREQMSE